MTRPNQLVSLFFASLLTVGLALVAVPTAQAQTPATTVKDAGGNVVFQSFAEGQLYVPGPLDSGAIPKEGAGTRLMWWPKKSAFRAGRVFDNTSSVGGIDGSAFWNASNVGDYSVAFGRNTKATGPAATAMGRLTTASGEGATAMGLFTTASGDQATAMGGATASGDQATAMGGATASGPGTTAMGSATASGENATAMGFETVAANSHSLTVGRCNDRNSSSGGTALFVVGNGEIITGSCQRGSLAGDLSDAFVVESDGSAIAASHDTFSDRRLKTAIEPIGDGALDKLADLRPVRYEFKNQQTHPAGKQVGLIAQDVQKAFPELVSEGSDGMLSLAYPKMTAVLLKGLQEQQAELESKQAQIDSLNDQIQSLREVKATQEQLAQEVAALKQQRGGALPAGWGGSALLALLLALGGFGAGLLWRRSAA